jgi:sulfoacetaldehyde dehydrogenase
MNIVTQIDRTVASDEAAVVADIVRRAHTAQRGFAHATQERVDEAVTGLAWSLYQPAHARELAELAVADTGLGNVADKVVKKQRKTFGTLRDLLRAKSVGVIEEDPARGLIKIAKPVGVVGAVTPSTNPGATPVNKSMMAIKGRNAIIIAPSPAGWSTTARTVRYMREELARIGLPEDLVQVLPAHVNKAMTQALMEQVDLVVVTGSQDNVRRAYSSGTPALGVGAGNVPVIVDETADLARAAELICASKVFDNATSCSSENAVVIVDAVYDRMMAEFARVGGVMANAQQKAVIEGKLWVEGKLSRHLIAKDAAVLAGAFGIVAPGARFFMVEEDGVGADHPFSGEKLSLVLAVYRAADFAAAVRRVQDILAYQGAGHSCGLHTTDPDRPRLVADHVDVVRVLVNQAHTFGNGGGFDNGLEFTLSMGCGTWGGNSISENLSYRHFLNITHLVTTIPPDKPEEDELFGTYWARYGK